jgi:hypothetical protein
MLLLKRSFGFLIDLILFYGCSIAIDFLFKKASIYPLSNYITAFGYICAILIPIISLGRPIGHVLFKLKMENSNSIYNKLSLLFKYIIYYLFFSSGILSFFTLFTSLFTTYMYLNLGISFVFRLFFCLFALNILCFLISFGKQNFLDFLLRIKYQSKNGVGSKIGSLILTYTLSITWLASTVIEYKIISIFNFKDEINKLNASYNQGYFPIEIFGNYILGNSVFVKYEYTNKVVTPSDIGSYIFNRNLLQRQIVAIINDETVRNTKKRQDLCAKLLYYSYMNPFDAIGRDVMQTRIVLVNLKEYNPFADLQSSFTYYYDDKLPVHGIYGGYNLDTLTNFYLKANENYFNTYLNELSISLNISKDSIKKYMSEEGVLTLPEHLAKKAKDTTVVIDMKDVIPNLPIFPTVKFQDVEPMYYLSVRFLGQSSNTVFVNNIEELFSDEKEENMFYVKSHYVYAR